MKDKLLLFTSYKSEVINFVVYNNRMLLLKQNGSNESLNTHTKRYWKEKLESEQVTGSTSNFSFHFYTF